MNTVNNKKEKLNYILNEITKAKDLNRFTKEAKKFKSVFYTQSIDKLDNLNIEAIKKHNFISEVYFYAENLQKKSFIPKLLKKVNCLETHKFAPELNTLHFKNRSVRTSQKTSIAAALELIIKNNSIEGLKKLMIELK